MKDRLVNPQMKEYILFFTFVICFHVEAFTTKTTSPFIPKCNFQKKIQSQASTKLQQVSDSSEENAVLSTSISFALDPESEEAYEITSKLNIDKSYHEKLVQLSHLVVEWNERLNLISRKDCTLEVVFGRHVLPSIAIAGIPGITLADQKRIVDVGTGGGFPGLPLAILNPEVQFLLVDSVGKKLTAVQEMADELGLTNIQTHHGRAEELVVDQKFDICVGRSVTAMPRFCFWIQDLLQPNTGKLIYIIGGDIEENVLNRVEQDIPIHDILQTSDGQLSLSDKRTLVLQANDVVQIAQESGEKKQIIGKPKKKRIQRKNNAAKGQWAQKDNSTPKSRGYENFKRFET